MTLMLLNGCLSYLRLKNIKLFFRYKNFVFKVKYAISVAKKYYNKTINLI